MSEAVPTSISTADQEPDPQGTTLLHARTTMVAGRMLLAANLTLQSSFLFAYLYLRANNFGGMWRPSSINPPATSINTLVLMVSLLGVVTLWAAARASARGERAGLTRTLGISLLVALGTLAVRVYQMYNTGWDLSMGAYVDISVIWFAVLLAEFVIGTLLLLSMYLGHVRRTVAASRAQVTSLYEYWALVAGVAALVYILVQFVN